MSKYYFSQSQQRFERTYYPFKIDSKKQGRRRRVDLTMSVPLSLQDLCARYIINHSINPRGSSQPLLPQPLYGYIEQTSVELDIEWLMDQTDASRKSVEIDIEVVMRHTDASYGTIAKTLRECDGDFVEAIMELMM